MQYDIDPNAERERHEMETENRLASSSSSRHSMNEDPDVLRDLVQQARGVPLDVQRITGTEIQTLRSTTQKASAVHVSIARLISGFFGGIFSTIGGVFSGPARKANTCEMYGHIRPKGGWSGRFPKCADCGIEITSEDQLRGSSARQ